MVPYLKKSLTLYAPGSAPCTLLWSIPVNHCRLKKTKMMNTNNTQSKKEDFVSPSIKVINVMVNNCILANSPAAEGEIPGQNED